MQASLDILYELFIENKSKIEAPHKKKKKNTIICRPSQTGLIQDSASSQQTFFFPQWHSGEKF